MELGVYEQIIHRSRYARWREEDNRRETWKETVERYISFFKKRFKRKEIDWQQLFDSIYSLEVMPSMRCLMTAGEALEEHNVSGYNCAYVAVDHQRIFSEILYVLCCGTGVGFSVEQQYVSQLPVIPDEHYDTDTTITIPDSKIGWAKGLKELLGMLYAGQIPKWDLSKVRPKGSRLKVFGGRASGPEPLNELFEFSVRLFRQAEGRKLNSLEVHDLVCKIADIVVVGGVRRSALISLSDLSDERMSKAKTGGFELTAPQRHLANNSVCYVEVPEINTFLKEWLNLYESYRGERGIFSRAAAKEHIKRNVQRRNHERNFGCNPCSEILLRSKQFCNLTEVVVRPTDTFDLLKRKVRIATILGTLQSALTDFKFLSKEWKVNCEEERLLGVSLTGIMDHPVLSGNNESLAPKQSKEWEKEQLQSWLKELKEYAIETNIEYAKLLGVNPSTAITCVKPSGTVSQLVDSASGIHPRYSQYYIRRIRNDKKDPLSDFLISENIPCVEDSYNKECWVFEFPKKAPAGSITRDSHAALQQLELWKVYAEHWCEHKPSITVYYKPDEFLKTGAWVYENFDIMSGVSFLPHTDHVYKQAPYQEITKEKYEELESKIPRELNWDLLSNFEKEDNVNNTMELACQGNQCEVV